MNTIASGFAGIGLAAFIFSGFATPASSTGRDVGTDQVVSSHATDGPADSADPADEQFWELNQAPLGTATATIEEQFPNEFAYAFFDESSAMHVAFAGFAPTDAVALLQNTGLPYVIVEAVGFNAADYEAAANDVVDQTLQYVTGDRQVAVSSDPSAGPGVITVSFLSDDPDLTIDPGLRLPLAAPRYLPVRIDAPFTVVFDGTFTSPVVFGTGTDQVLPASDE